MAREWRVRYRKDTKRLAINLLLYNYTPYQLGQNVARVSIAQYYSCTVLHRKVDINPYPKHTLEHKKFRQGYLSIKPKILY